MNSKLRVIASAMFLAASFSSFSQEQLGLRTERFSGISSAPLNPANLSGMALKWDANILGAAFFVESNYGFAKNASVPKILRTRFDTASFYSTSLATDKLPPRPGQIVIDYPQRARRYYGDLRLMAMLPAFAVHVGAKNTVGFSTTFRLEAATHTVPPPLGYPRYDAHPRHDEFELGRMSVSGMAWTETAGHFSHLFELENGSLAIGASAKYLLAHEAFFARANESFFLTKLGGDSLRFRETEFEGGITTGNFTAIAGQRPRLLVSGRGLGFDIGAVFSKTSDDLDDGDYLWKTGLALLDIGRVRIGNRGERHSYFLDGAVEFDPNELATSTDPNIPIRTTSFWAFGDSLASLVGHGFSIGLPLAVCAQGDFRAMEDFYANATLVQRIDFKKGALQRSNLLAVVPRFERRWWSASLPFELSEWRSIRFGLAARLGFLVVGTDDLGSFFKQKRLNSTDFYVALKINALRLWGERAHESRQKLRRSRVRCYEF